MRARRYIGRSVNSSSGRSIFSPTVIEVKSARDSLPRSLRPLVIYGIRKASFSKYLACYGKCTQTDFLPL